MERTIAMVAGAGLIVAVVVVFWVRLRRFQSPPGIVRNWLCYYGLTEKAAIYDRFDLVVFDGVYHPALPEKRHGKPVALGYASIGEVGPGGYLWDRVQGRPFLLTQNRFWNSWRVDVTHPDWQRLLLDTALPEIKDRGFDGFFLDNLDAALVPDERVGGKDLDVRKAALVGLIRRIRDRFPDLKLAVNRGLSILSDLAEQIDFVVLEGLYSIYAPDQGQYRRVAVYARNRMLQQVQRGLRVNPKLTVLTVDYAAPEQEELISEAITFSKQRGFVPYVSTYKLDQAFCHTLRP